LKKFDQNFYKKVRAKTFENGAPTVAQQALSATFF
jgi:hypothetical protein